MNKKRSQLDFFSPSGKHPRMALVYLAGSVSSCLLETIKAIRTFCAAGSSPVGTFILWK